MPQCSFFLNFYFYYFYFLPECSYSITLGFCSPVWLFATSWTVARQAPLSMGLSQARILEWVAISSSRGSFPCRSQTCISCLGRWILYHWATWESLVFIHKMRGMTPTLQIWLWASSEIMRWKWFANSEVCPPANRSCCLGIEAGGKACSFLFCKIKFCIFSLWALS